MKNGYQGHQAKRNPANNKHTNSDPRHNKLLFKQK